MADDTNDFVQSYFSKILVDIPPIADCFLNKLPVKTLNSCARVCRQWYEVAKKIKKKRQESLWILFTMPSHIDVPSSQVSEQINDRLNVMTSEPRTALVFLSNSAFKQPIPITNLTAASTSNSNPRACKQEKIDLPAYLLRSLPDSCNIVGVSTDGIVGTVADDCHPVELESCNAGSLLLLPNIKGLGVHTFTLTEDYFGPINPSREDLERMIGLPNEDIKVLFLFFAVDSSVAFTADETIVTKAFVHHYKNIVLAGGYVDNLFFSKGNKTAMSANDVAVGIAFYGSQVTMASAVLDQSVKSAKKAEECIKKLKDTHIPVDSSHHNFGFQFACVGRGYHQYHKNNVEADAFRKLFPNVPLFGFFGSGELGMNYLPDYNSQDPPKINLSPFLRLCHSYTTIMCVLSIPKNQT